MKFLNPLVIILLLCTSCQGQPVAQEVKADKNFKMYKNATNKLVHFRNNGSGEQPIVVYEDRVQADGSVKKVPNTLNRRQLTNAEGESIQHLVVSATNALMALHSKYVVTKKMTATELENLIRSEVSQKDQEKLKLLFKQLREKKQRR